MGRVPEYRVYAFDAADIELRRFYGGQGFTAAFECYHRLTADPTLTRQWLTRRDSRGAWEPARRRAAPRPGNRSGVRSGHATGRGSSGVEARIVPVSSTTTKKLWAIVADANPLVIRSAAGPASPYTFTR